MDTYRGLVTTIVILSIAVLLLVIPRLQGTRLSYSGTSPYGASTADFYTTGTTSTVAVPNLHFGGYSTTTSYTTPTVSTTPSTFNYYYTTYTTSQLPDETGYYSGYNQGYHYTQDGCGPNGPYSITTGLYCTY